MKSRSRSLVVLTVVLAAIMVLAGPFLGAAYSIAGERATNRCMPLAGTDYFHVEFNLWGFNWRCVMRDGSGNTTEAFLPLF